MSNAVYLYKEDFGRAGNLVCLFVADEETMRRELRPGRQVYLGEGLGKHSEVMATVDETTVTLVSQKPADVGFVAYALDCSLGNVDILAAINDDNEGREDAATGGG